MNTTVRNVYFIVLCLVILIFILGPLQVLSQQDLADVPFHFQSFIISISIYCFISFAFLVIIITIFNQALNLRVIKQICLFGCIYFTICIMNQVTESKSITMEGLDHSINVITLMVNIASTIGVFYILSGSKILESVFYFAIIIFAITLSIYCAFAFSQKTTNFQITLGKKNLIVFSFDGIPGISINNYFANDKHGQAFKDFTLFTNSISHSPATYASIHQEILGPYDWKKIANTEDDLRLLKDKIITRNESWYLDDAYLYGTYADFASESHMLPTAQNAFSAFGMEQNKLLLPLPIISTSFCKYGFCIFGPKYGNFKNYIIKFLALTGFETKLGQSLEFDYLTLRKLVQNIEVTEKENSSFLGHFIFSHFPIVHDENCNFVDALLPQTEVQINNQIRCVTKIMQSVVAILKEKGIYHNSLIVFKSDHGKPSNYYSKSSIRGLSVAGQIWGYDRYRPFVMIKDVNQTNQKLTKNAQVFYLSDLSYIYCEFKKPEIVLQDQSCSVTKGIENSDSSIDTNRYLYVTNGDPTFKFDGHFSILNKQTIPEMESMFENFSKQ